MEIDWKRFGVAFGAKYLERHIDDDEFWAQLLRRTLKPALKELNPLLMVQSFEENYDFKRMLESEHLEMFHNMIEGNEDLLVKLKEKSREKMIGFSWDWIEVWWKKDHPNLLAMVLNYPEPEKMKKYVENGVRELADHFTNSI